MKKLLYFFAVIVLGVVIVTVVDHLIGVRFKDISAGAEFVHKIIYMLLGCALVAVLKLNKWL